MCKPRLEPTALHGYSLCGTLRTIASRSSGAHVRNATMAWTTPVLVEICLGLEINGYLPAEF
jgi:coenzyme PQQ precursor peptide PqqA